MNRYFFIFSTIFFAIIYSPQSKAQIVSIPDPNFKSILVNNPLINTNGDTEIDYTEAVNYKGAIYVSAQLISDLTGIEAFIAITDLNCSVNQITNLDISQNTSLITLNCSDNAISTLDVSNNVNLSRFFCINNALLNLDVSANTALTELYCDRNQINTLDLSQNTTLAYLGCSKNSLSVLDLSTASNLIDLNCSENQLSTLDLSNNTALIFLNCRFNQLTNLNVFSHTALSTFICSNNQLSSLNLSSNIALDILECSNNPLASLDLQNNVNLTTLFCGFTLIDKLDLSNNTLLIEFNCNFAALLSELNIANGNNISIYSFIAENCINLNCIQVDDTAYSNANWTRIESYTNFNTSCNTITSVEPVSFKKDQITVYPNPVSDILNVESQYEIQRITIFDMGSRVIKTGVGNNIRVSELPQGLYILNIQTEHNLIHQQFAKY